MATDAVTLNAGAGGDDIAADLISGVHHQLVKVEYGAADSATQVDATNPLPVSSQPFAAVIEVGITSLIGINDTEMSAGGDYSNTADLSLGGTFSGEILSVLLVSSETGAGTIQTGRGVVFFFDADPNVVAGDTDLAAAGAEHKTIIGMVKIEAGDWDSDANGASVMATVAIPFHAIGTVYAVYRNTDGSAVWNLNTDDDELLDINVWFRRDS